jgi:hypothetical protein
MSEAIMMPMPKMMMVQIGANSIINLAHVIDIEKVMVTGKLPGPKHPEIRLNVAAGQAEGSPTMFYVTAGQKGEEDVRDLWDYLCSVCVVRLPSAQVKLSGKPGFQR